MLRTAPTATQRRNFQVECCRLDVSGSARPRPLPAASGGVASGWGQSRDGRGWRLYGARGMGEGEQGYGKTCGGQMVTTQLTA